MSQATCTEVRMVPWNATQHATSHFSAASFTAQKGGITFDGRPGGVPDPAVRGPAMVQIGNEGGFLSGPAVIPNQPINYEYNLKNILVTNVKQHALLLGAAERADVVVDFSQFAGSTLILYNDAPAAMPAFDLRLDNFTGDFDNSDTGGTFSTVPGYGSNTRTIMQFKVAKDCTTSTTDCGGTALNRTPSSTSPVDDVDNAWLTKATSAIQTAFKYGQEPMIVPQAAYNPIYGVAVSDTTGSNISRISDTTLSFMAFDDAIKGTFLTTGAVNLSMGPKAIQELFTNDYGRMNATLGTEVPNTTGINQTTIPLGYVDPPTELVQITNELPGSTTTPMGQLGDGTQIWKITHNGVDTHPVHFHLFSVQLLNRVGWDGAIYPPEPNELGWKEVLRMNPLSDVIVALRPKEVPLPFKLGNSHHVPDPSNTPGALSNLDPTTGNAPNPPVTNLDINYGWEYVWHCHILGHEENDFMRPIAVATPPEQPTVTAIVKTTPSSPIVVTWNDNSIVSNWVTIQRATDPAFTLNVKTFNVVNAQDPGTGRLECANAVSGCQHTWLDTTSPVGTTFYYRVQSNNTVGAGDTNNKLPIEVKTALTPGFGGHDNVTARSTWSASRSVTAQPNASVSPVPPTPLNIKSKATQVGTGVVTVTNTGTGWLNLSEVLASQPSVFSIGTGTNACSSTLAPSGSCSLYVNFTASSALPLGIANETLTLTTNDPAHPTFTIPLSGAATPYLGAATNLTGSVTDQNKVTLNFINQSIGETGYGIYLNNAPATLKVTTSPVSGTKAYLNYAISGSGAGYTSAPTITLTGNLPNGVTCTNNPPTITIDAATGGVTTLSAYAVPCTVPATAVTAWNAYVQNAAVTGIQSATGQTLVYTDAQTPITGTPETLSFPLSTTLVGAEVFTVKPLDSTDPLNIGPLSGTLSLNLAPPIAPLSLLATPGVAGSKTINMTWANAVTTNKNYQLQMATSASLTKMVTATILPATTGLTWTPVTTNPGTANSYSFAAPLSGGYYVFQLAALGPNGTSSAFVGLPTQVASYTSTLGTGANAGRLASVTTLNSGLGYQSALALVDAPPSPNASATAALSGTGTVSGLTVSSGGQGYTTTPPVTISAPPAAIQALGIAAVTAGKVTAIATNGASLGYWTAPRVTVSPPQTAVAATGVATLNTATQGVSSISVNSTNFGYWTAPTVTVSAPTGSQQATATATLTGNSVSGLIRGVAGSGYVTAPTVTLSAPAVAVQATGTVAVSNVGIISNIAVNPTNFGYWTAPSVTIPAPPAVAQASATVDTLQRVTIKTGGAGYCTVPAVTVSGGTSNNGGPAWRAQATLTNGAVTSITITGNRTYSVAPTLTIAPPPSTQATATAIVSGGRVTGLTVSGGNGYCSAPTVGIAAPTASQTATASATVVNGAVSQLTMTNGGAGYTAAPTVSLSAPQGNITATATTSILNGAIAGVTVTNPGTGYTAAPTVTIAAPTPSVGATATATLAAGGVTGYTVTNGGGGYATAPTITIGAPTASVTATASTTLTAGKVSSLTVRNAGANYTVPPTVTIGSSPLISAPAQLSATLDPVTGASTLSVITGGSNYQTAPAITVYEAVAAP